MVSRPVEKPRNTSHDPAPVSDMRRLLQQLVSRATDLRQSCDQSESDIEDQDVILDEEVNGVRCLLVRSHPKTGRHPIPLSPREQEIARMVAEGHPNKTIAAVLDISSWTVCTHLRRIFAKLNVRSRAAMVARLLEDRSFDERPGRNEVVPFRRK